MIVDLTTAKKHLRVTSSNEDTLISLYMAAAEDHIIQYLDDPYLGTPEPEEPDEIIVVDPDDIPASIKAAQLLIIADMYENREAQGEKTINQNLAVQRLLYPYRINLGV